MRLTTMIRARGRLAGLLVVGLGVALAFDATTSATGPDRTAASNALDSSRTQDAETSSDRGAVADWSLIAQDAIVAVGKKFPGEAAVHMGIVHATIYDVVVAIEGGYRPFAITPTVPPNTSLKTAVATAAHRVLVGRFRDSTITCPGAPFMRSSAQPRMATLTPRRIRRGSPP
jgi:hypothetical protein